MRLGTHDSTAYNINFTISFWNKDSQWEKLRKAANILPCVKSRVKNMTLTQRRNITDQLNIGIKVLDIRISFSDIFWCIHTFATVPLSEVLQEIYEYVLNNKVSEKIILLIKPDYMNRTTVIDKEKRLVSLIYHILDTQLEKSIICYYELHSEELELKYYNIRNMNQLNIIWFNSQSIKDFVDKYNKYEPDGKKDIFNAVLTPNEDISFKNLFCNSVKKYASKLNPLILDLIKTKSKLPYILLTDFV